MVALDELTVCPRCHLDLTMVRPPDLGRRVMLWEWLGFLEEADADWHPATFRQVLAAVGGGLYTRTAAHAIEAMVRGEIVRTTYALFRFRTPEGRTRALAGED